MTAVVAQRDNMKLCFTHPREKIDIHSDSSVACYPAVCFDRNVSSTEKTNRSMQCSLLICASCCFCVSIDWTWVHLDGQRSITVVGSTVH
jgi:hypothetical protein